MHVHTAIHLKNTQFVNNLTYLFFVFYFSYVHDELKEQLSATMHKLEQSVIDSAIKQLCRRLTVCDKAKCDRFIIFVPKFGGPFPKTQN